MPDQQDPLLKYRKEIDRCNLDLAKQLVKRFDLLEKISEEKKKRGIPPFDFVRHREMMDRISCEMSEEVFARIAPIMEEVFHQGAQFVAQNMKSDEQ